MSNASILFLKYEYVYGGDWEVVRSSGERVVLEEGISQATVCSGGPDPAFVFNFPLEVTFRSTNPHGWPQLVVSVFELDRLGRDRIRGYGRIHIPVAAGHYSLHVPLFHPVNSSPLQAIVSFLTRRSPEFVDAKFISRSDGREVTRVASQGSVRLKCHVITRHMDYFGYTQDATRYVDADPLIRL